MTLDPVNMLLPVLATWFYFALVGLLSDNPVLACSDLEAWGGPFSWGPGLSWGASRSAI